MVEEHNFSVACTVVQPRPQEAGSSIFGSRNGKSYMARDAVFLACCRSSKHTAVKLAEVGPNHFSNHFEGQKEAVVKGNSTTVLRSMGGSSISSALRWWSPLATLTSPHGRGVPRTVVVVGRRRGENRTATGKSSAATVVIRLASIVDLLLALMKGSWYSNQCDIEFGTQ